VDNTKPSAVTKAPGTAGRGASSSAWILGSWFVLLLLENLAWLRRHVLPSPPPWDPALYLRMSLRYAHALAEGGRRALWTELQGFDPSPYVPPLFPLSAVPLYRLFGESRLVAYATSSVYLALLLLGTYHLARGERREGRGLLAVFLASTFSAAICLSRDYQTDLPAAALLTLGIACLARSDGFRSLGWSLAFGGLAGLALLTKTMSAPFGVAPALAALFVAGPWREARRARWRHLVAAVIVLVAVASVWWAAHLGSATWYLLYYGWGAGALPYDEAHAGSVLSLGSLSFYALALANRGASLGYAVLALVLLVHAGWQRWRRGGSREPADATTQLLWTWLLSGYAILSVARNKTPDRYVILLLPPVAALLARGLTSLPRGRSRRVAFAAATAAGIVNYVSWTWPNAGVPQVEWRPPFSFVVYRPEQAWLRVEIPIPRGDWPLQPIVATLARLGPELKARLVPTLLVEAQDVAKDMSPEEFVRLAYRRTLRREPDPVGLQSYAAELRTGAQSHADLLRALSRSEEFAARALSVLVVPDHPFLNASTLSYYAEAERLPLRFTHVEPAAAAPWQLAHYDAVLVKQGGYQGSAFATTEVPRIEAQLREEPGGLGRSAASFACPDGSVATLLIYDFW
jgi:4-amino-4-deoxy-L-arabinose transferase-like glycosyltransferase